MPSHRMNSGTPASTGIARTACPVGSSSRRARPQYPETAPSTVPDITPRPNPATTRVSVAMIWRASSPLRASSTMVANSFEGGGTSRPLDRPSQTMISQANARPTGSSSPSAGRAQRPRRPDGAEFAVTSVLSSAGSSTDMAIARTLLAEDCKLADRRSLRSIHESPPRKRFFLPFSRCGRATPALRSFSRACGGGSGWGRAADDGVGDQTAAKSATTSDRACGFPPPAFAPRRHPPPQSGRGKKKAARAFSIRRQRNLVVDQRVERCLDVDLGLDHPGLLQRDARGEDRLALRRADPAVGELGALLEVLVAHRVGQFGDGNERLLQVVVVRDRIFARVFIDREHAASDFRIILQELFAHIENAPGVGVGLAEEQFCAVLDFRLRHHRIETRPGIDIAADP